MNLIQRLYMRILYNLSIEGLSEFKTYSRVDELVARIQPTDEVFESVEDADEFNKVDDIENVNV